MNKIMLITILTACSGRSAELDIEVAHSVKGQISCLPIDGYSKTCKDETGEIWICSRSSGTETDSYACARISAAMAMWDAFLNNKPYEVKKQ